jgi:predicted nucleotidyltransferase
LLIEVKMVNVKVDKHIFKKFNVKLAYIFGSQAKGKSVSNSDFDIAVLFKKNPSDPLALREITYISSELNKFFPTELDIVSLNDAPLLLKYEVVAHGRVLYCEKEAERINFEVSVIKEYIDEEPIRNLYNQALYKRISQRT